jgi:hypothetical protein
MQLICQLREKANSGNLFQAGTGSFRQLAILSTDKKSFWISGKKQSCVRGTGPSWAMHFKNVNSCWNTNIYSYLKTSGSQS